MEGIEPTRPCGHQILSLARLPIPPHRRTMNIYGERLWTDERRLASLNWGWRLSELLDICVGMRH